MTLVLRPFSLRNTVHSVIFGCPVLSVIFGCPVLSAAGIWAQVQPSMLTCGGLVLPHDVCHAALYSLLCLHVPHLHIPVLLFTFGAHLSTCRSMYCPHGPHCTACTARWSTTGWPVRMTTRRCRWRQRSSGRWVAEPLNPFLTSEVLIHMDKAWVVLPTCMLGGMCGSVEFLGPSWRTAVLFSGS